MRQRNSVDPGLEHFHPWAAAALLVALTLAGGAARASDDPNAALTKLEQKCVVKINKQTAKLAKVQGKRICKCIKNAAKGKLIGTIEDCVVDTADPKVAKAVGKLREKVAAKCLGQTPGFGIPEVGLDPNVFIAAVAESELALIHGIFDTDLDAAILPAADPNDESVKPTFKCQLAVAKAAKKCFDTKWKVFIKCKKNGLKGKVPPGAIDSARDLESLCLQSSPGDPTSGLNDPSGKAAKACGAKLQAKIDKRCVLAGADLARAFPEFDAADPNADLLEFVEHQVECEFCLLVNQVDGLLRDCDLFDDGQANGSCGLALDHFKLYRSEIVNLSPQPVVTLRDQFFEDAGVEVRRIRGLANPTSKTVNVCEGGTNDTKPCGEPGDCPLGACTGVNATEILDPNAHLLWYDLGFAVTRRAPVAVDFRNQFGDQTALLHAVDSTLLVPARKGPLGPSQKLDHFRCYDAEFGPDQDNLPAVLVDQFVDEVVNVRGLRSFCNPVDKNGEGIRSSGAHLACYAIGSEFEDPNRVVNVGDQFDPNVVLEIAFAEELCVPSIKLVVGLCGDGKVDPRLEECDGASDAACPGSCGTDCRCIPSCPEDPTRTTYAGGLGDEACRVIVAEGPCLAAWHRTILGEAASCHWTGSSCLGCGLFAEGEGECTNTCVPPSVPACDGDASRVTAAGGPSSEACRVFGDEPTCLAAWHVTFFGDAASCFWTGSECRGCGPNREFTGECTNSCRVGAAPSCADTTRTTEASGYETGPESGGTEGCQQFLDQGSCEAAWHRAARFGGEPASCFWAFSEGCLGCGQLERSRFCRNSCTAP